MYKLLVAVRYLRRNWLNLVAVAAVAIGVMVLICVLSVMKGFDEEFRARIRATLSDLIVESWSDKSFAGYAELTDKIRRLPHVQACAPHYEGLALLRLDTPSARQARYGQFHGIDLSAEIATTDFASYWRAWRGRTARDQLAALLDGPHANAVSGLPPDALKLLNMLRREDFELLSEPHRRTLRAAAKQSNFDLAAAFQAAEVALPEWGDVADPDRESPAFAGGELLVVARDIDGNLVRLGIGDQVVLFTPTDMFDGRAIRRCRVKGQFHSGLYDYDLRNIYLPLSDVQRFMDKPGEVTSINIRLDSFANAPQVRAALVGIMTPEELREGLDILRPLISGAATSEFRALEKRVSELRRRVPLLFAEGNPYAMSLTIQAEREIVELMSRILRAGQGPALPSRSEQLLAFQTRLLERERQSIGRDFRISTWEDKRRTFLRAVWLERRIMGFILFFVILIAGFLILSILHTTVVAKTRDIGILKSIGGSVRGIMAIFLLNGLLIGMLGAGLGTLGGMLITRNINEIEALLARLTGFSLFPADIYYLDKVPIDKDPFWSTLAIAATAVTVSFLASAYPAWKASRMDPVEALRYE